MIEQGFISHDNYPEMFAYKLWQSEYPDLEAGEVKVYLYVWSDYDEDFVMVEEWYVALQEFTE